MNNQSIGINIKKIKSLMGENETTRTLMAHVLGISSPALRKKLNGEVDFKASEIIKIANYYGVKIEELF